jgi:hypothetical protein
LIEIVLGRELVEIIPQTDHLRRLARRANLNVGKLQRLTARFGACEYIAGMNRDRIAFQCANADFSTLLKANPFCHVRSPGVKAASFDRAAVSLL